MKRFTLFQIKRDLTRTLLVSVLLSFSVFGWLRIIFFEFPFSFADEVVGLLKTVATYWALTFGVKTTLNAGLALADWFRKPSAARMPRITSITTGLFALLITTMMVSCNMTPKGVHKDFSTGMVTRYTGLVPEETNMIMNGEVMNHTEIPLGETFTVINKNIKGLVEQNGQVSVGCSLKISDTMGQQIFFEPDLFRENGIFAKNDAQNLKCHVNTGRPMEWEKTYAVTVVFWDKFGKGRIENSLNISTQDIP